MIIKTYLYKKSDIKKLRRTILGLRGIKREYAIGVLITKHILEDYVQLLSTSEFLHKS